MPVRPLWGAEEGLKSIPIQLPHQLRHLAHLPLEDGAFDLVIGHGGYICWEGWYFLFHTSSRRDRPAYLGSEHLIIPFFPGCTCVFSPFISPMQTPDEQFLFFSHCIQKAFRKNLHCMGLEVCSSSTWQDKTALYLGDSIFNMAPVPRTCTRY